ncbi:MAG: metallophosphoesterase family protein [Candidatus Aminicenantes bacterium]|nr:metallophosphoesterase family protein [Candidatus Aminicenantes bacterium]
MRVLVFSDIHGNLEALAAVLRLAEKKKIDHYVCLGDLVGYGASPNEVVRIIRRLKPLSLIRGNHDKAVCSRESIDAFNPIAAAAIRWTRKVVTKTSHDFLHALPQGPQTVDGLFTICHGAPFDEDFYIFGEYDADEAFGYIKTPIGFFGHTHFPFVYVLRDGSLVGTHMDGGEIKLEEGSAYLINPGSVGQPRDRNPKAACLVYDTDHKTVRFHRLEYDIASCQKRIRKAELPAALADRLASGL